MKNDSIFQNIKQKLSIDDIRRIVSFYGGDVINQTKSSFMCDTICHNKPKESSSHKMYFYSGTNLFHCYTECSDSFDIFELLIRIYKIQKHEDLSVGESVRLVLKFFDIEVDFIQRITGTMDDDLTLLDKYLSLLTTVEIAPKEYEIFDDSILTNLKFVSPVDWVNEGISTQVMNRYGIKYYGTDHKIVIPHYDLDDNLVGIRGRALVMEDAERYGKYMPLIVNNTMYNHALSNHLYALNLNYETIKKAQFVFLYEGEKSVMLHESLYGKRNNNSTAVCGRNLSIYQIELLKMIPNLREIVIAYDKQFEEPGTPEFDRDVETLTKISNKLSTDFTVSVMFDKQGLLDYKDAPIDKGIEVFQELFNNRLIMEVE